MRRFRRWPSPVSLVVCGLLVVLVVPMVRRTWLQGDASNEANVVTSTTHVELRLAPGECQIVDVLDGRTLHIQQAGRQFHVRLIGVSLPDAAAAIAAKQALQQAAPTGPALIELDKRRAAEDGSWLAYVYVEGRLVNAAPLRAGWCRYDAYPGDSMPLAKGLREAQAEARRQKQGVWAGD